MRFGFIFPFTHCLRLINIFPMKVLAIKNSISNGFSLIKCVITNSTLLLVILLMFFQSFCTFSISNSGSIVGNNDKLKLAPSSKKINNVLNQIIINTTLKTSYCTGEASLIVCQADGVYNNTNTFSVVLSDKNGSFNTSTIIGTLNGFASGSYTLNFKIPTNTPVGSAYRIRVVASNPLTTSSDNGFNISITTIPAPLVSTQVICRGQSAVLSATCSQGIVRWYDSDVNTNPVSNTTISPTQTTDYFASCEQGSTCSSARIKQTVTVRNFDNIAVPPSASSCLNSDLDLAVITEETDLTYSWSGPNGFTSTSQTPTITNLTLPKVGVYTVLITNSNSCSATRTTAVIVGQTLQGLNVVGDVSVCYNGTISLTALASASGLTYSWSGPNSFSATGQSISRIAFTTVDGITTYQNGSYTVVASNTAGCSGTTSVDISVGSPPNVPPLSPTGNVCEGSIYNLDWAIGGANFQSYVWTGPNGFNTSSTIVCDSTFNCSHAVATIANFQSINAGVYTIQANFIDDNFNFCVVNASKEVTLKPNPNIVISSNSAICLGDNLYFSTTFTGTNLGVSSYTWTGPNNFTASIQNPSINTASLAASGIYKLSAIGVNSCFATATTSVNVVQSIPPIVVPTAGVVLSNSITLTATGCSGTLVWYNSSDNQLVTMPVSPIVTTLYYAKCNTSGCVSGKSGDITVSIKSPIAISVKTGDWEDKNTWDILRVPLPIDSVIIRPNHFITINSVCSVKWLAWSGFGNLVFKSSASKLIFFGVTTSPPVLSSNPTNVMEGIPVTFTVSGSGVITWYKNGISLNVSGTNYTVSQPVKGDIYTAKRSQDGSLSAVSNAITVAAAPPQPPILTSSPSNVIENISATFTAIGSGIIIWYKNGVDLNINGNSYTVSQPVKGDIYTTKRSQDGLLSVVSNAITVEATPPPVTVPPPVLSSNPTNVIENISVTFTATGSGIITWYKNGVNLNISGNSYTISQPVKGDIYTTKASENSVISVASNAITVEATPPVVVTPPVLDSNPVTVIEGIPVIFTATGTGIISWYKNGINLNVSGTNYTVNQPVRDDIYTVKSSIDGVISGASNGITVVAANSDVTITQPNKPPYYFSDGHPPSYYDGNINLPAIFTNQPQYDPVNDFVWLKNDKIKIGINLKRGGQLAWASLANATTNLVYNGYDGGFQVTLDAYQRKDGYTQGGEVAGSGIPGSPTFSYNVTQGGDFLNHAASLIDYHSIPNGYYVKLRPIHYPLNAKFSETFIEITYTIIRRSVKIEYRYTSFRTDGQWDGGGFDGAGAPACFIVNTLNKYKTYTGNSPWTFSLPNGNNVPNVTLNQNQAEAQATEYWGMVYDAQNPNSGLGVYNATNGGSSTYFTFKQLEVHPENGPGTEFSNGFTFFQPFVDFNITNRANYVKDITAYLMIGNETEIRKEVYKFSGHEANIPVE